MDDGLGFPPITASRKPVLKDASRHVVFPEVLTSHRVIEPDTTPIHTHPKIDKLPDDPQASFGPYLGWLGVQLGSMSTSHATKRHPILLALLAAQSIMHSSLNPENQRSCSSHTFECSHTQMSNQSCGLRKYIKQQNNKNLKDPDKVHETPAEAPEHAGKDGEGWQSLDFCCRPDVI